MPLMRPFNNKSSAAARPMSKPPISPLTGVKFSIISCFASHDLLKGRPPRITFRGKNWSNPVEHRSEVLS
jgi:hypothetical protein